MQLAVENMLLQRTGFAKETQKLQALARQCWFSPWETEDNCDPYIPLMWGSVKLLSPRWDSKTFEVRLWGFLPLFWLHDMWILVPDQWWNSCPLQWKRRVLGKSLGGEVSLILSGGVRASCCHHGVSPLGKQSSFFEVNCDCSFRKKDLTWIWIRK